MLGFRPSRAARSETLNEPKPIICIVSPSFRALVIASKTASVAEVASALDRSDDSATAVISSVLFIIIPLVFVKTALRGTW